MFDIWKSFCCVEVLIVTIVQKSMAYSKVVNNCKYWLLCSSSKNFLIMLVQSQHWLCAVLAAYSLVIMQCNSVKYKKVISIHSNSHTFERQLKIKKHISLKLLNSLYH